MQEPGMTKQVTLTLPLRRSAFNMRLTQQISPVTRNYLITIIKVYGARTLTLRIGVQWAMSIAKSLTEDRGQACANCG